MLGKSPKLRKSAQTAWNLPKKPRNRLISLGLRPKALDSLEPARTLSKKPPNRLSLLGLCPRSLRITRPWTDFVQKASELPLPAQSSPEKPRPSLGRGCPRADKLHMWTGPTQIVVEPFCKRHRNTWDYRKKTWQCVPRWTLIKRWERRTKSQCGESNKSEACIECT